MGEERFDFDHLAPFSFTVPTRLRPRGATIDVRFSNHCYSESYDAAIHGPDSVLVWDRGRRRVFSLDRYIQSRRLRGIVEGFPSARIYHTPEANFVRIVPNEPAVGGEYRVYFNLKPGKDQSCNVRLFVESAYPATDLRRPLLPAHMTRVRFALLIDKVMKGERLAFHYKR